MQQFSKVFETVDFEYLNPSIFSSQKGKMGGGVASIFLNSLEAALAHGCYNNVGLHVSDQEQSKHRFLIFGGQSPH